MSHRLLSFLILLFTGTLTPANGLAAPGTARLSGTIRDASTRLPQDYALIRLTSTNGETPLGAITDSKGLFSFRDLAPGTYNLKVTYTGYREWKKDIRITADTTITIALVTQPLTAQEVVVTASESRGGTSASRINRTAMEHLQPSSFSDLLSLLPGGLAKDPQMGSANLIRLREAGNSSDDYDISSLGTAFTMDGIPISTDANLQSVPGSGTDGSIVSKGLDMRTIPTDNIESVEIVRGIPSVEYGNLTSGLVNIKRRARATPFEARVKADEYGKLFSAGKGIAFKGGAHVLNLDADYLNAKNDPRNTLANFKRITASARLSNRRATDKASLDWRVSLDYSASIDSKKSDADLSSTGDRFKAAYNKFSVGSTFNWKFFDAGILRSFDLTASVAQEFSRMDQTKQVYLNRPVPLPTGMVTGEHDAELLPFKYQADVTIDGKPMNAFLKALFGLGFVAGGSEHSVKLGADWKYDKNFGQGQVYDITRPINPNNSNRPRAFSDIPAGTELSLFAEDAIRLSAGKHRFVITAGVRAMTPLNLSKEYSMRGKVYVDPRLNVEWKLPTVGSGTGKWEFEVAAGIGRHTKTPTLDQPYPDPIYADLVQLNYYPAEPDLRRINLMTYVWDNTNFDLRPARNLKWEVRLGATHQGARFSVTYFQERMTDGFRAMSYYKLLPYKKYDASAIDPGALTGPPDLDQLPYTNDTLLNTYGRVGNGSRIDKRGVEFQFSSPRIDAIKTRITVNGAWFRTTYSNSTPLYRSSSVIIGGDPVKYVGLYDWQDGSVRQQFNTNVTFDTYLANLGLTFSTTFQCLWYTSSQPLWNDGTPISYVDASGVERPFTEADKHDTQLQWLVQKYSDGYFDRSTVPFAMDVNFKATKHFGRWARLAIYVNRLFSAYPSYYRGSQLIRRQASPYFGMELNLTF